MTYTVYCIWWLVMEDWKHIPFTVAKRSKGTSLLEEPWTTVKTSHVQGKNWDEYQRWSECVICAGMDAYDIFDMICNIYGSIHRCIYAKSIYGC